MSSTKGTLTDGPILKVLMKLAVPIMVSAFLSTAYSITDMIWVGKLGAKVVAGVGVGGMYIWLSCGLSTLTKIGGQVYVGQELGAGKLEQAKKYACTAVWLTIFLGILFGLISVFFTNSLVAFFGLDDPLAVDSAKVYIRIACGLVVFQYLGVVLTGLYTAQGNSETPLKANFLGLAINMILDPLLILGIGPFPRLEGAGAALATVIAQMIVVVTLIVFIQKDKREENVLYGLQPWKKPEKKYLLEIIKMGGPVALQSSIYCGMSMILSRMITAYGDAALAVQQVGGQIESISWNTAEGFGSAMNAFAAQNYGAKEMKRIKKGYRISACFVFLWGGLVGAAFIFFPEAISNLFFHEAEAIMLSIAYFMIIGFSEAFMCLELMAEGAIAGLGKTKLSSTISIVLTALRIPLAFALSKAGFGLNGIWIALAISSVSKGIAMHIAFKRQFVSTKGYTIDN